MRRALYALLALLILLVILGGGLLYFAYGTSTAPPAKSEVVGLRHPVDISWNDAGVATIRADSLWDQYAALGYVHGTQRPWLVALWRQTATGRLGEWFGRHTLPLDRLSRRLGFAKLAREAYATLPENDRALLRAYANGMNAAFQGPAVQNRSEFALLDQTPTPWKPWHALAIERLYAYLASSPPPLDSLRRQGAPPEARRFLRADSSLRRWLHVHDIDDSAAWAVRSDAGNAHLFYRHVYGRSAIPPLQAVLLQRADAGNVMGLSLPGTPFLVAGRAGSRAWALLPDGRLDIERAAYDTTTAPTYERVMGTDGNEHLVTIHRSEEALLLSNETSPRPSRRDTTARGAAGQQRREGFPQPDTTRIDSLWQVRWAGFQPITDLQGWQTLAQANPTVDASSFRLLRAGGLTADSSGSFEVFGTPARSIRFEGGLVAGPPDWTPFLADQIEARLQQVERDTMESLTPEAWIQADSSTWAARLAPDMLASIDSLSRTRRGTFTYEERTDIFGRAIRYLRNWNFRYDRASIGASIFDTWVAAYRRQTGRLPAVRAEIDSLATSDSLRTLEDRRRFRLLDETVSQLSHRYGDDIEQWRWETVAPDTRYFPGWSDSLTTPRLRTLARTRYAPIELPGDGHPSTLDGGSSPISPGLPAPAAYEAWISTNQWGTLYVRRRRFDTATPFGRYRAQRYEPDPLALRFSPSDTTTLPTTTLTPADTTTFQPLQANF